MNASLKIAVIQFECRDGEVEANLRTAEKHLAEAAAAGAELALFTEFMSCGYDMSANIWSCAETLQGRTVSWLCEQAAHYELWLGTSILETDGKDFLNTFVLAAPDGRVAGTVRKQFPAAAEAYRFRGVSGSHIIETPLGRIGVGICYESLSRAWAEELLAARPDFVLLSFSGPVPTPSRFNPPENGEAFVQLLERAPTQIARLLGVPVAYANKTGRWKTRLPFPLPDEDSYFPGASRITDGAGETLAVLGDEPGFAIATVEPGKPGEPSATLPDVGRWNQPVPDFFRLFRLPETLGAISYRLSRKRRAMAKKTFTN